MRTGQSELGTAYRRVFRVRGESRQKEDHHRTIEITVPPANTGALISKLKKSYQLVGLTVHRGASIKPPGDVLVVHALNRDADRVMRLADEARSEGQAR